VRGLSFDHIPPLSLPLRYFLCAPWFGVAAALVLLAQPAAFQSRWSAAMLGAVHLLTVGFMLLVMVGALLQLVPVLLGRQLAGSRRWAPLLHAALCTGAVLLPSGFILQRPNLLFSGAVLLVCALALLLVPLARELLQRELSSQSVLGLRLAAFGLVITLVLGAALSAGHVWPTQLPGFRLWTDLHAGWALFGWVQVLVMAVAIQVIPMFHVAKDYPPRLMKVLVVGVYAGLVVWTLGGWLGLRWLAAAGLVATALGGCAFALISLRLLWQRRRRASDPGVAYWYLGLGSLLAALLLGMAAGAWPELRSARLESSLGVLLLLGFACSVIAGMLHKIVAFLLWLHLQRMSLHNRRALQQLPSLYDIIPPSAVRLQLWLHLSGVLLLLGTAWLPGQAWLRVPGLLLMAAAFAVLGSNLFAAAQRYRRCQKSIERAEPAVAGSPTTPTVS
jgi:hypothetical protein